ncbi:MAG: NYN domain-containing protein [Aestuariivita sp.]|nr:NYN domain-containing protein [Aestuariivita sp.]
MKNYIIYVDGFNLYYAIKDTKYKWLDLKALIESFSFEDCKIAKIRYFTAKVTPNERDPDVAERQNIYLRALRTIPEIEIHFGSFKKRTAKGKLLEKGNPSHKKIVEISKFEEKGSDVNIATFMLIDCFQKACDVPILLSNDSDLTEPLKYIKTILKLPVGLITPVDFWVSKLHKYSSLRRKISDERLRNAQFPLKLKDDLGEFSCPKEWL